MTFAGELPPHHALPQHVAIIMDGNGRWAVERGSSRLEGHQRGADVVRDITTFVRELGIPYLTLFSFSVQNWRRPLDEVAGLMQLLEEYCARERRELMDNDIRLRWIGELAPLPESTQRAIRQLAEQTADNQSMTLTLAINYGGREELVRAAQRVAQRVASDELTPEQISEATIDGHLDTAAFPDPDLLIRTSGEHRISNFMLWQLAYAEVHFTEARWPEFNRETLAAALWDYARRERRFGGLGERLERANGNARRGGKDNGLALEEESGSC